MKRLKTSFFLPLLLLAVLAAPLVAQDLASFEKRITVRELPNGLTVIICRRPEAPVFSFSTFVDAGSVQDPRGKTGLAHMMEHMAFKGTDKIGTTNYTAEKAALDQVEAAYAAYNRERLKRVGRDDKKVAALEKAWKDATSRADKYVIKNQFGEIVEREGGVGLNAGTGYDETEYLYSMPVNRTELWAYLESERFLHPTMREFYKERDVVIEERRMRTDSQPIGRLVEQFLGAAFSASAYHRPTVGYMSDLNEFSATDAINFFKTYYVPSNMVVSVTGDVDPAKIMPVIERYFGRIPSGAKPTEYFTNEPPQNSERQVILRDPSQPFYIEGYHRPDYRDPDDAVYDAITDLMSSGRTSRLYRSLVRDKKIAAFAAGFSGFPGTKYPHLFAFYAVPTPGHTPKEMADGIRAEIERLKTQDVTDDELKMVKTRAKASLIRSLDSNSGLASNLATMQARYGDWRELFRQVDRIDRVTKEDIRRVAKKTFVENNRTVGLIETAAPAASNKGGK
ncbi:MAG TPA: pitrilysin family protein [Clostridia bacterium]|nr:pitrilysin family protein [Clostridia bacterium]